MIFTFCFASDGKTPGDAREQANLTGEIVLFLEGIFRYVLLPKDDTLYDYTTREDVARFEKTQLRKYIIEHYGVDPDEEKNT